MHATRRAVLALAGVSLAGCLGDEDPSGVGVEPSVGDEDGRPIERVTLDLGPDPVLIGADPPDDEPTDAPPFGNRVLPLPRSPAELSEAALSGGVPRDGIPSIDDPVFVTADEADFLPEHTTVFGITMGDETKVYPRRVLVQHEIVNDVIDATPVSLTYCPLTGTAQGFFRGTTEFGVSGRLINSNLVMYDRTLERWWPQIPACSIPGPWSDSSGGATLEEFNVIRTSWARWRERHPETLVMSEETGFARIYEQDPYGRSGYYQSENVLFETLHGDERHHPKTWVYGVRAEAGASAILRETLAANGVIHGLVGNEPFVAVYDRPLDTAYVYANPDEARFEPGEDGIVTETGEEVGPDNLDLERLIAFDAYWFAWVAYYPHSVVYE